MKTVYLDHNLVHYYVKGFPPGVDEANERHALDKIDRRRDGVRIVFSVWNLVEGSREKPREKVCQFAQFIQDREPYWIQEKRVLQRDELQSFVFSRYFGANPDDSVHVNAIALYLTQILHNLSPSDPVFVGEQPKDYMLYLFDHPADQKMIRNEERRTPEALKILQQARSNEHLTSGFHTQTVKKWISSLMPKRKPDGKPLIAALREDILAYCVLHYEALLLTQQSVI